MRDGARRLAPLAMVILVGWGMLFYARAWDQKLLLGDEGVALMGAARVLGGEVPGGDFFEIIPPVSFLPTALAFLLFGVSVASARLVPLLLEVLIAGGVLALLAKLGASRPSRLFSLALLIPLGVAYWPIASHHWWVDAFQIWAVWALLPDSEGGNRPWRLALGGALAGLAVLTLQDQGGYFLIGLCFFYFPFAERKVKTILHFLWGFLAATFPVALWLLLHASAADLWYGWVVFPLTRYHALPSHGFWLFTGWKEILTLFGSGLWLSEPGYSVSLLVCGAILFALPAAAAAGLALGRFRRVHPGPTLGLLTAGSLAFLGTAVHRWALTNAVWAAPMLLVAVGATLGIEEGRPLLVKGSRWAFGIGTVFALLFGVTFYRLSAPAATVSVSSRIGTLRTLARRDAAALQGILDAVEIHVPEGEALFPLGFMGLVNILTDRPNPSRFNVMIRPNYNTEAQARMAVEDLRKERVRWIVGPGSGSLPEGDPLTLEIRGRYDVVWTNGQYTLWGARTPRAEERNP